MDGPCSNQIPGQLKLLELFEFSFNFKIFAKQLLIKFTIQDVDATNGKNGQENEILWLHF